MFDLIILDPPSFTRNRHAISEALRGYKEIHLRAMRLLRPGGILASFCCSHHIDPLTFEASVIQAAMDNRWILRRVATFSQPVDHPIVPSIPETQYLKGFAYQRLED
jgi:23S rRNA (cytosine1962-C5)-methyltransferase